MTIRRIIFAVIMLCCQRAGAQHDHSMHITQPTASPAKEHVAGIPPRKVVYHLHISDTTVNYTGRSRQAIAVNGQIPGPVLRFTEGDTAVVYVHNGLRGESSVHWHGLILPNRMDGVPYLTTAPIPAGGMAVYEFPLVQSGTYWYHSHSAMQEQVGLYGALVVYKRGERPQNEYVLLLSDWTDRKPMETMRSLKSGNDWDMVRKNAVQSYGEALLSGNLGVKFANEWKRQHAMDLSDIYYDALLANGKGQDTTPLSPGEQLRLRVINGSSSTYFWLQFAGGPMTVVASDGKDVDPVTVDRMIIAVAETYDITLTVPDQMSYELRATGEDRTRYASLWIGDGMRMPAPELPRPDYFAGMRMMNSMTRLDGNLRDSGMAMSAQGMDMNEVMYPELKGMASPAEHHSHGHMDAPGKPMTLNYTMLRSPEPTALPQGPWRELRFTLEGNMHHYLWSMDNRVLSESDRILIKRGENIRMIIRNNSMMRHPMHLHGHYFRVLNGQDGYSPLKNVVDIMPGETDTLEFAATESGDWFFHCHILYHMMGGMGRVFSYEDSPYNPDIDGDRAGNNRRFLRDDLMVHTMLGAWVHSNGTAGEVMAGNTRYALRGEWHAGWRGGDASAATIRLGRYIGKMQYLFPYAAWDYHYKPGHGGDNRSTLMFGVEYTLPMLITADLQADIEGRVRFKLGREDIPLTRRLRLDLQGDTDWEYRVRLRYVASRYVSIGANYNSDTRWGAGIVITY